MRHISMEFLFVISVRVTIDQPDLDFSAAVEGLPMSEKTMRFAILALRRAAGCKTIHAQHF